MVAHHFVMRHVIEMLRYLLEHLDEPMTNAQITTVTGLVENYTLTLFTRRCGCH